MGSRREEDNGTLRLFIAIELPGEVQAVPREARARFEGYGLAVRWVDPEGTHLTLKFLGATPADRVELIREAAARAGQAHQPFVLQTAGTGVFPHARAPRVVWLGVAGMLAELRALQQDVERFIAPLGFPTEKRAFNPHLTLGRTAKNATPQQLVEIGRAITASSAPAAKTWQVMGLSLMGSELRPQGAHYTRIADIPLGSA